MCVSHHPILRLSHFDLQHIFISHFMPNRNYDASSGTLFSPLNSLFSVPETCNLRAVWISECYSRNDVVMFYAINIWSLASFGTGFVDLLGHEVPKC
jgi:hypothetical protein